ncbi:MAG: hypothetical protein ACRC7N_04105 [Clostridium sp.]
MAKYDCKCGEVLWNGNTPNDIELVVYTDREWSKILESDTVETWNLPEPKYDVWMCPKCNRIYVFDGNKLVKQYVEEVTD